MINKATNSINKKLLFLLPICLLIYGFTGGLSNDIYLPAMPSMVKYFNTTDTMVQLTLSAWGVGVGIFQLFLGPWSDHYGRRPALILGGIIFLIGSFACALATTVEFLLFARFVQGVGTCSMFILTMTAIRELFVQEARTRWLVYYNMMRSMAPLIGPLVGSYLLLWFSWRASFWIIFVLAFIAMIGLILAMPETNPRQVGAPPLSIKQLLKDYGVAFRDRFLMRYLMANVAIFGGLMVYLTSGAFIVIERVGLSEQAFGYSQAVISGAYILGAACIQRGYKIFGAERVAQAGIVLSVLGALGLAICSGFQENIYTILMPIALYSFGFGMCSTPLIERALSHEGLKTGLIAGLIGFAITISSLLGTFLASIFPSTGMVTGLLMFGFASVSALVYRFFVIKAPPTP